MEFVVPAAGIEAALATIAGWPAPGFAVRLLRLAGLRPSSQSSQRRMVSRPISMPSSRRPDARVSGESPAWCRRSSSSRCDVSCAVAWLRGCRTCSTAWAKVVGRGVISGEYAGSDMGADGERYVRHPGGARGAPQAHSKRKRLDVGVLPYCFVLFLLDELSHLWCSLVGWLSELVDSLSFGFRSLVKWWWCGSLVEPLELDSSVVYSGEYWGRSSCAHGLVSGGGGC